MRNASDESLMKRYGSGDMAAFEILYERYRGPLYRFYLRHVSEPATANDLYQGCWEKVINFRERYRDSAPFKAWLFRIAHNHLVDHWRASRPTGVLDEESPDSGTIDPSDVVADQERGARLRAALDQLPPEQREVVVLKLEAGLSVEEIGKITGAGFETAKSRLRYATRKLKQALDS